MINILIESDRNCGVGGHSMAATTWRKSADGYIANCGKADTDIISDHALFLIMCAFAYNNLVSSSKRQFLVNIIDQFCRRLPCPVAFNCRR